MIAFHLFFFHLFFMRLLFNIHSQKKAKEEMQETEGNCTNKSCDPRSGPHSEPILSENY